MTAATAIEPAIREALSAEDVALARELFVEYQKWLAVDLCFQGFADELATLPGAYARPRGRLLLAGVPGQAFGCIALRPLPPGKGCSSESSERASALAGGGAAHVDAGVGEVKRLFVRAGHRHGGWGRRLAETLLAEARGIGYHELKLDTLEWMTEARRLYEKLGFRECPPYYDNPLPGVVYMARAL